MHSHYCQTIHQTQNTKHLHPYGPMIIVTVCTHPHPLQALNKRTRHLSAPVAQKTKIHNKRLPCIPQTFQIHTQMPSEEASPHSPPMVHSSISAHTLPLSYVPTVSPHQPLFSQHTSKLKLPKTTDDVTSTGHLPMIPTLSTNLPERT